MLTLQGYYDGQKIRTLEAIQAKKNQHGKRRWQKNKFIPWRESDIVAVSEKVRIEEDVQEMQIFKELDKGIDDVEAGRVIENDEAMRILKEHLLKNLQD